MQYKNKFGKIQVMKDKKLFRGKTLAISMSGGADSTMLCYLLAKTSYEQNLEITIQPYNGYDTWAPIDSAGVPNIIKFIRKEFMSVDIQWPISTVFDTNGAVAPNDKNKFIRPLIEKLTEHRVIDIVMNGISMGPPIEIQQTFKDWDKKINVRRLSGYHLWDEVERAHDHLAPFKQVDKRFIVQCYKDFGIEKLLKKTNGITQATTARTSPLPSKASP